MMTSIWCQLRDGIVLVVIIFILVTPIIAIVCVRLGLHPSFGLCAVDVGMEIDRLSSSR
jgi:hypothetical protein